MHKTGWQDTYALTMSSDIQVPIRRYSEVTGTSSQTNRFNYHYKNSPEKKESPSKKHNVEELIGSQIISNNIRCDTSLTVFEQRNWEMKKDPRVQSDLVMGRRVGFYQMRASLGAGNFSEVKLAVHTLTGERVAVKIMDKTQTDSRTRRLLDREVGNMEHVQHPRIIRLYEVIENLSRLYIVLEYAAGGELYSRIVARGRLPEKQARCIFGQIASALQYIHSLDIIHRDLKAENILFVEQDVVKLADFGFSIRATANQNLTTFCGSPPYAAPELFTDDHYVGPPVDIWALGVLLFFMVTGTMPFNAQTIPLLKENILKAAFVLPIGITESCQQLVLGILQLQPNHRLNSVSILKSAWLKGEEFVMASTEGPPGSKFSTSSQPFDVSDEDLQTRQILEGLGINQEHLESSRNLGVHSAINGAYRIVLHRVQWRRAENKLRRSLRKKSSRVPDTSVSKVNTPEESSDVTKASNVAVTISLHTKQGCQFCSIL